MDVRAGPDPTRHEQLPVAAPTPDCSALAQPEPSPTLTDMGDPTRKLYFGDNLEIMREHVADESVDLVYLDPPFNSKQTYNVLFKTDDARPSQAQMEAFEDTWHWTPETEAEWSRLVMATDYDVPPNLSKGCRGQ